MVVIGFKNGRLANRLMVLSHCIANAVANGYLIVDPTFDEYAEYFEFTRPLWTVRYPLRHRFLITEDRKGSSIIRRLLSVIVTRGSQAMQRLGFTESRYHAILKLELGKSRELGESEIQDLIKKKKVVVLRGTLFEDRENLQRHSELIRALMRPKREFRDRVGQVISELRANYETIVGVHVRRADYRRFANGKYFFDLEQYRVVMNRASALFPGQRIVFLLCSDESIEASFFAPLPVVAGPGHFLTDMYCFAETDYLIGPPSTYTAWASFYGKVPLYFIRDPDRPLSLESFRIIDAPTGSEIFQVQ